MPSKSFFDDPQHWRQRAEGTRTLADAMWNVESKKRRLLKIAEEYDRLAEHAERRVAHQHSKENTPLHRR